MKWQTVVKLVLVLAALFVMYLVGQTLYQLNLMM